MRKCYLGRQYKHTANGRYHGREKATCYGFMYEELAELVDPLEERPKHKGKDQYAFSVPGALWQWCKI